MRQSGDHDCRLASFFEGSEREEEMNVEQGIEKFLASDQTETFLYKSSCHRAWFGVALLIFLLASNGLSLTLLYTKNDLINFWICFVLTAMASAFLVGTLFEERNFRVEILGIYLKREGVRIQ